MMLRLIFVVLWWTAAASVAMAACDDPARLTFSLIPQANAQKDADDFKPLLRDLELALDKPIDVYIPSSYGAVIERLLAGSADLAMMGPASYARAKNADSSITAFATIVKRAGPFQDEGTTYRSLLIVHGNSRFATLGSLKAASLLLVDPDSTSGSVIPRHLLTTRLGTAFERYFGRTAYSGGHDKSARSIVAGQADAAFVASFLLADYISEGKAKKEDFRVIWQSEPIPLDPFVYRGNLCERIKEKIRQVFLGKSGEAYPKVLEGMKAARFSAIGDEQYRKIREILRAEP